jgi:hypothetical protein
MLALYKLHLAKKRMIEATYKQTLRPKNILSDLDRALSGDFVSIWDMTLSCRLYLTHLNNKFLVILVQESKTLGYGVGLRKTIEKNDSVTELERIKANRETISSLKSLCVAVRKTHEVTWSTSEDEFRVN